MMLCKLAFYLPQASHHPLPPLPHYARRKLSREQADDVDAFGFPDDGYDYRLGPLSMQIHHWKRVAFLTFFAVDT